MSEANRLAASLALALETFPEDDYVMLLRGEAEEVLDILRVAAQQFAHDQQMIHHAVADALIRVQTTHLAEMGGRTSRGVYADFSRRAKATEAAIHREAPIVSQFGAWVMDHRQEITRSLAITAKLREIPSLELILEFMAGEISHSEYEARSDALLATEEDDSVSPLLT